MCVCVIANLLAGGQMVLVGSDLLPQQWTAGPGQALQNFLLHLGEVSDHRARQAHVSPQHQLNDLSDRRKNKTEDGGILQS